MAADVRPLAEQLVWLFVLAIPVACVSWTVTQEEVFREWREFCQDRCDAASGVCARKFFYVFTCEYCFSHWVTLGFLALTGYHLLLPDWRGVLLAWFAVVWVANGYMSLYRNLRLDIKAEGLRTKVTEKVLENHSENSAPDPPGD